MKNLFLKNKNQYNLRVFVDETGHFGNPVMVILDEKLTLSKIQRQEIARDSGLSEVVFIDDIKNSNISIFCPTDEIEFAGQAVIAAVFVLDKLIGREIDTVKCAGRKMMVKHKSSQIWVQADLKTMPPWNFRQLKSPKEVNDLELSQTSQWQHSYVWAWEDKNNRVVRARTFARDWLIPEDEANGSGSMLLAAKLKCSLKIFHGKGSVIYANPIDSNFAEVGGVVFFT